MSSNYPPGVTGNEPQIAGWPPCGKCGHEAEYHASEWGEPLRDSDACQECDCTEYDKYPPAPDPDDERDRRLDEGI